ncbi:MAG TPA: AraC family transcriptional regulator [Pilimelia sp.]|nr:AraC family transcriptional regulator [Pilimelia sp.]
MPVYAYDRAPGIPPVRLTRLRLARPPLADGGTVPLADDGSVPRTHGGTVLHAHAHDFLVLLYVHRGTAAMLIDGREWAVTAGDVIVIAPGQVVDSPDPDRRLDLDAWLVYFPAEILRQGTSGAFASWRAHPLLFPFARGVAERAQRLPVPPAQRASWLDRLTALDAELQGRRDGYHEAVLAHLTLLLVAASRLSADVSGELRSVDEPVLAAAFDAIEARFHEPISLADVATEVGLSAGHLTTLVRRKTGRTVQQWITERRMREARRLLADTDLTVAAVGRRVGYGDVSYFVKRFRADHALAPLQWRRAGRASAVDGA